MDAEAALLIGKLISSVEALEKRIDEFLKAHDTVAERVSALEQTVARTKGAAWFATTAAGLLGLDRLTKLFH